MELSNSNLEAVRISLINDINQRLDDKILEKTNANLLIKLINQADSASEAIAIAELGTTYKPTGLHFDKRIDKISIGTDIKYLAKNDKLSFETNKDDITHQLIIGDNYDALLNLLISYKSTINVIYIDPPYGKDSMGNFAKTNYDNEITRDNLLSMLYPRLILARELLTDDGVIFCSIDDRNHAYVKCLFDEVFYESNCIANIVWNSRKSVSNDAIVSLNHNYTLIYTKNMASFNSVKSNFKLTATEKGFANPDNDPKGKWKADPFDSPGIRPNLTYGIENPNTKKVYFPPNGRCWRTSETEYKKFLTEGRILFGKSGQGKPQYKRYLSEAESKGLTPKSIWDDCGTATDGTKELQQIFNSKVFDTPKPVALIKKIVDLAGNKDSVILDFFAGSGTTGQAVLELNKEDNGTRKFILCTNNEITDKTPNGIAYDVTSKRLKRIMTGKCYDNYFGFSWIKEHFPLGGNLEVTEIKSVYNAEQTLGKSPFDVIDETLYGLPKFSNVKDKIHWVCSNFDRTQNFLEENV